MKPDMKVRLAGMELVNPVIAASGTFGYGIEFEEIVSLEEIGGFAALPIMEDCEIVRRLRKRGRVVTAAAAAITSGRRWRQLGLFRTTLINQLVILGHLCGVSPDRLAAFYRGQENRIRK